MAAPIEVRYWLAEFTLEHLKAGVQPVRQVMPTGEVKLFHPPTLQLRWREKTEDMGLRWSEWIDARYEREGDA